MCSVHVILRSRSYALAAAWTVSYDTLYAHQDKVDDAALGLRSSALLDDRVGNVIPFYSAVVASGMWCSALALQVCVCVSLLCQRYDLFFDRKRAVWECVCWSGGSAGRPVGFVAGAQH